MWLDSIKSQEAHRNKLAVAAFLFAALLFQSVVPPQSSISILNPRSHSVWVQFPWEWEGSYRVNHSIAA